jgi:hypothetical protein
VIGLRDRKTGAVTWSRNGLPLWLAKRYHDAGWTFTAKTWVPSLNDWAYSFHFVGESAPGVDETPAMEGK